MIKILIGQIILIKFIGLRRTKYKKTERKVGGVKKGT